MQLDLVISVDTAIVHLAGALGRPVWALLPLAPDWRWMLGAATARGIDAAPVRQSRIMIGSR